MSTYKKPSMAECDRLLCQPGTTFEIADAMNDGRRQRVWKHTPPDFRTHLTQRLNLFKDRTLVSSPAPEPAPVNEREYVTYGEVHRRAIQLAAWLRERGVGCGTRVGGIGAGNCTGWVVSFVAIHLLGAVPVILNSTLQPENQVHCLKLTKPAIVLADARRAGVLAPFSAELRTTGIEIYSFDPIAHLPAHKRAGIKEVGTISVSQQSIRDVETGAGTEDLNPDSDSMIMFTPGTISQPKAVLLTQRGSLSHMRSTTLPGCRAALREGADLKSALARFDPPPKQPSYLVAVPLFHVTGCLSWLVRALNQGAKVTFMRRWNVKDAIQLIQQEKVTVLGGVPAIVTSILQSPLLPRNYPISAVSFGGAPPPKGLAKSIVQQWSHASVTNGYGSTETNGILTSLVGKDYVENPTSVGYPTPLADVLIVDPETKAPLERGTTGLLMCRGTMVMKEYVGNPEATAEVLADDGWFNTGDLAVIDENGWISIQDRAKDMIIRGGENLASAEVEHALSLDPRVAHAAAVPVPDEVMGERVGVAVTLSPASQATPQSIIAAVEPRLRYAARPAIVVIIDTLPRNAAGKVLKNEVRQIVGRVWAKQNERARL